MITLTICITIIVLVITVSIFGYLRDKNDKKYDTYMNCMSDTIDEISYRINLIKEEDVYGDIRIHINNIKRLCNKFQYEVPVSTQSTEES